MSILIFRLDIQYSTIDYLYTPTYTRIGPYFVGVYAGWFLSQYERKLNISKVTNTRLGQPEYLRKPLKESIIGIHMKLATPYLYIRFGIKRFNSQCFQEFT